MCVLVHCEGRWCETRGELSTALGAPLVDDPLYAASKPQWHDCLCSVDIPATCDAAGYEAELDDGYNWLACPREE